MVFGWTKIYLEKKKLKKMSNAVAEPKPGVRINNTAKNKDAITPFMLVVVVVFVGISSYVSIFHGDKMLTLNFAFELFGNFIILPLVAFALKKDLREFTLEFYGFQ